MIKGAMRSALGVPVLFLGLSGENVTRLAAGEPIRISASQMAELGLPQMEVILHYGRTEQDILDDVQANGVKLGVLDT